MAKQKYRFDPVTLTYTEEKISLRKRILKVVFTQLSLSIVIGTSLTIAAYTFIPSPALKQQKRENEKMKVAYNDLRYRLNMYETVLKEVQDRDNNIYRNVFEAEPIPSTIRDAGIGGVNRYKKYQGLESSELVVDVARRIDIMGKKLYIQTKSFDQLYDLMNKEELMRLSMPAIIPVKANEHTSIGSTFGARMHPILKVVRMHDGIDITAPVGTDVLASGNGKVIEADWGSGFGYYVVIDHGFSYKTVYAHLSEIKVRQGQKVTRGDIIGLVGNTGLSTCPHLHYEVRKNDVPLNPVNYWIADVTMNEYQQIIEQTKQMQQSLD